MYDAHVGVTFYYDGLGSTRSLTDSLGQVTDTYTYNAYGTMLTQTGSTSNNYLFTGEQYDSSQGNYYLRKRYYAPDLGRFTQMDTFLGWENDPVSLHKYLYANADPVNGVDPSGKVTLAQVMTAVTITAVLANTAVKSYDLYTGKITWKEAATDIVIGFALSAGAGYSGYKLAGLIYKKFGNNLTAASKKEISNLLADAKFQKALKDVDCVDCDDIARALYKVSGGKGKILDLTVPGGKIKVKEFDKIEDFVDHRVFSDGKNIYDPRFSDNPIPIKQYINDLRKLNPNLVVKDITP